MRLRRLSSVTALAALLFALPAPAAAATPSLGVSVVQSGLVNPWDLAFTPDGKMLVTERPGRVRVYASGNAGAPLLGTTQISSIHAEGEAGAMGIALDAGFSANGRVYVCASRDDPRYGWSNQVRAYTLGSDNVLRFSHFVIRGGMIAGRIHNGCAVAFGPDGKVWVTMGDAGESWRAQDARYLNGKVLRANPDGTVPADNPLLPGAYVRSYAYSMGHRNPQGLAFQPTHTLRAYAVEHGPDRDDEINRIVAGGNYGWPCVTGSNVPYESLPSCAGRTFSRPLWSSGSPTLATSGAAFVTGAEWGSWSGNMFVPTLKEQDLRRFTVDTVHRGRLRALVRGGSDALRRDLGPAAGGRPWAIGAALPDHLERQWRPRHSRGPQRDALTLPRPG